MNLVTVGDVRNTQASDLLVRPGAANVRSAAAPRPTTATRSQRGRRDGARPGRGARRRLLSRLRV